MRRRIIGERIDVEYLHWSGGLEEGYQIALRPSDLAILPQRLRAYWVRNILEGIGWLRSDTAGRSTIWRNHDLKS